MTRSFLLRFQEPCSTTEHKDSSVSTATFTRIAQEGPDQAPSCQSLRFLPANVEFAGTITESRVRTEQSDADFISASRAMPVGMASGTKSITAVRMETADDDYGRNESLVIPRCS